MTKSDIAKVDRLTKPKAPERIYGWLDSQLSIARYSGAVNVYGHTYVIAHISEEGQPLVREDVLKREQKAAKDDDKAKRMAEKQAAKVARGDLL